MMILIPKNIHEYLQVDLQSSKLHEFMSIIRTALEDRNLMGAYLQRPAYQQNDYIGWITRAKLPVTRQKRLEQMLDELFRGDVYMKMAYRPRK